MSPLSHRSNNRVGEGKVWLMAGGLAIGLSMVLLLLGNVLVQGLSVFWPQPITVVTTNERTVAGIILEERVGATGINEVSLYTGNREVYGIAFSWIKRADILERTTPKDLLIVERMEHGKGIIRPRHIVIDGGSPILASDAAFAPAFTAALERVDHLRKQIYRIEIDAIGENADTIESAKLRRDVALDRKTMTPEQLAELEVKIAAYEKQFIDLDAERRALRQLLDRDVLACAVVGEKDEELSVGTMLDFYAPNQLGWFGRLGRFFKNAAAFVWENPRESNTEGGVFPAIIGTFVMTLLMSAAVMPMGVIAAVYLREYAKQGFMVRCVRIAINNLAGVPSIVFGVFGLGFFVYFMGSHIDEWFFSDRLEYRNAPTFGTGGILWAALTLALMTVPVVIVATEEAIAAVPRGVREGSLALGASKWQTMQRIVLPGSVPGILTGLILAMARGAGEVAPLMLVGVIKLVKDLPVSDVFPFIHPSNKFMHLGFHIYDLGFQSPDSDAARPMVFATTLLLIVLVLVLNLTAIILRERVRRRMLASAF